MTDLKALRERVEPVGDKAGDYVQTEIDRLRRSTLKGLTKVQRQYVRDGSLHGDVTMRTVLALRDKHVFALRITSPNGQWGHMKLTPLGMWCQDRLRGINQ